MAACWAALGPESVSEATSQGESWLRVVGGVEFDIGTLDEEADIWEADEAWSDWSETIDTEQAAELEGVDWDAVDIVMDELAGDNSLDTVEFSWNPIGLHQFRR